MPRTNQNQNATTIEFGQGGRQRIGHTMSTNRRHPNKGPNLVSNLIRRQSGHNEFGFQRQLFRERLGLATSLFRRDLVAHFGCVNAIEFSADGELLVSGLYTHSLSYGSSN